MYIVSGDFHVQLGKFSLECNHRNCDERNILWDMVAAVAFVTAVT